jgi:hypothetical protein
VIHHLPHDFKTDHQNVQSLAYGFQKHLASDKIFHQCEDFVGFNKQITLILRESGIPFPRDWFLAHILTELMLDRAILIGHPKIADELYTDLDAVHLSDLSLFLSEAGLTNTLPFLNDFQKFKEVRYLESYTNSESIAYAVYRIAERVHINITSIDQRQFIIDLVLHLEPKFVPFVFRLKQIL